MHNDFTVFSRVVPSGKRVIYYYAYDEKGKRRGPWSTCQTSKTAGRNFVYRLLRSGRLIPGRGDAPTFAEYAKGWWEWETCPYLKERRKRLDLTEAYARRGKHVTDKILVKHFGKMRLDRIDQGAVEKWMDAMIKEGYKNTYTNGIFAILKVMLNWAVTQKVIESTTVNEIALLKNDRKALKIVSREEFKAMFVNGWQKVWDGDRVACTANKLAALSGMRSSEVLGLRGEFVFEDHIFVCKQFDRYGYRDTKTKDRRNIPLPKPMIEELKELVATNGQGYLFSNDKGASPVPGKYFYNALMGALGRIGMDEGEIKKRGLCFHAWRHFCNTELQKAGLTVKQVQAVTGHKSNRMTELYSHFDPMDCPKVPLIQEELLRPETESPKDEPGKNRPVALRIVKPEEGPEEKRPERKLA